MLNGTEVVLRNGSAPLPDLTDTGVLFLAELADRGPLAPIDVASLEDLAKLGARASYSLAHDVIRTVLAEGGRRVVFSRVVGPAAATATVSLSDGTAATIAIDAIAPGASYNALSVDVDVAAGKVTIKVLDGGAEVLRSPELSTKAEILAWAATTTIVRARSLAGTGMPAATASAQPLTGGSDDRANVTDASYGAALDRCPRELGTGQVLAMRTTQGAHALVDDHCRATNRSPLYVCPNGATETELLALASALRVRGARAGGVHAQWATVDGPVPGTTVQVPYAAIDAGIIARVDAESGPHTAAAGVNGVSRTCRALSAVYSDAERSRLDAGGVIVAKPFPGGVRTFGNCTPADPVADSNWVDRAATRVVMRIAAELAQIGESYDFATIDGQGRKLAEYAGELRGRLLRHWRSGALFGATADEAFGVETGAALNRPASLLGGQLIAAVELSTSPHPGRNRIEITKQPITAS